MDDNYRRDTSRFSVSTGFGTSSGQSPTVVHPSVSAAADAPADGHTAAPERIITITGGQGNTIPDKNSIPTNNPTEMNIERKSVDRNQRTDAVQVPPSAFLEVHLTYWPSSSPVLVNRRATTLSYYTLKTINLMSIINLLSRQHSSFFPLPPPRLLTTFFLLSASLRMIRCSCQPIRDRNTFISC